MSPYTFFLNSVSCSISFSLLSKSEPNNCTNFLEINLKYELLYWDIDYFMWKARVCQLFHLVLLENILDSWNCWSKTTLWSETFRFYEVEWSKMISECFSTLDIFILSRSSGSPYSMLYDYWEGFPTELSISGNLFVRLDCFIYIILKSSLNEITCFQSSKAY